MSFAIENSPTRAEAIPGSTPDPGGTAGQEREQAVDLEALKTKADAVAAAGRTVHKNAAQILSRWEKSRSPDEQIPDEAVSSLRVIVTLSRQLAAPSEVLGDAVETAAAGQLTWSVALGQAQETFDVAKGEFDRVAEDLLKQIRIVRAREATRESLADAIARLEIAGPRTKPDQARLSRLQALECAADEGVRVGWRGIIPSSRGYRTAQQALAAAMSGLVPILAPPVMRQAPAPGILLSVYGFFDEPGSVEGGYGLYTYVLLVAGPATASRNLAFLKALLGSTHRIDGAPAALRPQLNIFYVPAHSRIQALVIVRTSADAAAAIAAPDVYHYQRSEELLIRLCTDPATSDPELCSSAWQGPYLLTLSEPLRHVRPISPTHLLVDLSDVHEHAFGEFIRAIKQQVMRPDFTDREKVDALRLRLLDITLKAADWLDPIKEGIAEIVFVGGGTAK